MKANLFIDGKWIETEKHIDVENPATLEKIGEVAFAEEHHINQAVDAAAKAFESWKELTAYERASYLQKWFTLIEDHKEDIARIMTIEQGKPYAEALGEVNYANSFVSWYAEEAKRVYGQTVPASSRQKRIIVLEQPVGVVAAITPWNFPAAMVTRKIAPALAAGCTVVIKPSEFTPFTAYKLVELAHEAGIPEGVINIVTGNPQIIGELWMKDVRVRKLSFTGSTRVGKLLMSQASSNVKKLSLELGGHAPFIVTQNADLKKAVQQLVLTKFRNAGQTCVCANRIYVHNSVVNGFVDELKREVGNIKVGNGLKEGVDIGPLINGQAVDKVQNHIQDAKQKGAEVIVVEQAIEEKGYFVEPTVLVNVKDDMLCMKEETFGPVIPITTFETLVEVIERANNTQYGLAAYINTQDIKEAITLSEKLEFGIIGINDGLPATAQAPFGGMKESGLGREGGHWGITEFLETKFISLQI